MNISRYFAHSGDHTFQAHVHTESPTSTATVLWLTLITLTVLVLLIAGLIWLSKSRKAQPQEQIEE